VINIQNKAPSIVPLFFASLLLGFFESFFVASLNPYTWQIWFGLTVALITPKIFVKKKTLPKIL
jgi:hypothetical protein